MFTRKVTRHATTISPLVCGSCNAIQVHRWEPHTYGKHNSVVEFIGPSINLKVLTNAFGPHNGSTHQILLFSTMTGTNLAQAQDLDKLSMELECAVHDGRFSDGWRLFEQHIEIGWLPKKPIVSMLITSSAESLDDQWLEKAYGLVEEAFDEGKQILFDKDPLIYLSLSLAKCGKVVMASTILRKLIETEQFPPLAAWSAILAHMSQTAPGAYLAVELILEISYLFQDGKVDPRKKNNAPLLAMKPNTNALNTALAGCLLFGTTRKAELLLEMMPRVGVKANTKLLMLMAHIYERNGRRNELIKLQGHIEAHNLSDVQFQQLYNCLVSCHLQFGDLDSASDLLLEMLQKEKETKNSLASSSHVYNAARNGSMSSIRQFSGEITSPRESHSSVNKISVTNTFLSYEEFSGDRYFSKLEAEAKRTLDTLLAKLHREVELVTSDHGILQPTEKVFVKLVKSFLEAGRTSDLAQFLIKAEKQDSQISSDNSLSVHVINTCISLGWLDEAHDLLDEMRLAGVRTGSSVYASLLKAYCKSDRGVDVTSLLRDARKAGIQLDSSCYEVLMQSQIIPKAKTPRSGHQGYEMLKGCAESGEAGLMGKLLEEIKGGQRDDHVVHDWNNVIHFFCQKRLMQDAEQALSKMRSLGHTPNAQTFHSMVTGYAAVGGKYLEVTDLWGQMKSIAHATSMKLDQELLDSVLYTFVRGGFFSRANEVVELMEKERMFIDKYKYRTLFLKYHRTTYKGKAPKSQTEAQLKKREAALNFKKWLCLY